MITLKNVTLGLSITLLSLSCLAQQVNFKIKTSFDTDLNSNTIFSTEKAVKSNQEFNKLSFDKLSFQSNSLGLSKEKNFIDYPVPSVYEPKLNLSPKVEESFFKNKRNLYSSMWAFTSLNYLYADVVGLMDANVLAQYQSGNVGGTKITPKFLTVAAGFMQIPLSNVFLPHVIKNEKTLRWVQIVSGTIMTLVQTGTLFVEKPTPYYALFSAR